MPLPGSLPDIQQRVHTVVGDGPFEVSHGRLWVRVEVDKSMLQRVSAAVEPYIALGVKLDVVAR
jgi:hypothetical protein